MNTQEIRDKLMAAINGIIKDEPESADANLHDVLAAKMRARINGEDSSISAATDEPSSATTDEPSASTEEPKTEDVTPPIEEPTGA